MTPAKLSELLGFRAEAVCRHLLPGGRRKVADWVVGDLGGGKGESLKVRIGGEDPKRVGVWSDFATGQSGGDLLDLWMAVRGIGLKQAMREVTGYLGVKLDGEASRPKRTYRRPPKPACERIKPGSPAHGFLASRGFTDETIAAYKLATSPTGEIVFPYLKPDGSFVNAKYRRLPKTFRQEAGAEPCLFGWHVIESAHPNSRWCVLTEGELDAMSLHQMGIPALSVPMGGGSGHKHDWIESDYDELNRFDTLYLCLDMDEPGRIATDELVKRLGSDRCRVIELPHPYKDANDGLMAGMTGDDFRRLLDSAKTRDPDELKSAAVFVDQVLDEFDGERPGSPVVGVRPPWASTGRKLVFRPGETTLWFGYSGHGKALDIDTPIPTPSGWTTMGDIKMGDWVFDELGYPCQVVAATDVWTDRPCYKVVFSDGSEIIADANHEWRTDTIKSRMSHSHAKANGRLNGGKPRKGCDQSHKRNRSKVLTTMEIAKSLTVLHGGLDKTNHSVPVSGALQLPYIELSIDPYCLGLWLGDGTSSSGSFTTADIETLDGFRYVGYTITKHVNRYSYGILGLSKQLRKLKLINNKHIPTDYLRASFDQRLSLLRGLMDSDGHITDYGRCEFCSINETLANGVLDLVISLGIQARMITGEARLNGRFCGIKYRVTFTPDIPVFRLARKAERLVDQITDRAKRRFIVACSPCESRPVRCIQVDSESHLYLAGRTMIPTHNSSITNQIAAFALTQDTRWCIASMEMPPRKTLYRLLCQLLNTRQPSTDQVRETLAWLGDKLWLFDVAETTKAERMLAVFDYAVKRYDIRHYIVDSLTKCGLDEDDFNGQKRLIDRITDMARRTDSHFHVVGHARKGDDERDRPNKHDQRGATAITDMVDNVVTVWRDKDAEEHGRSVVEVEVHKQRHYSWEGRFTFDYHADTFRFLDDLTIPQASYLATTV